MKFLWHPRALPLPSPLQLQSHARSALAVTVALIILTAASLAVAKTPNAQTAPSAQESRVDTPLSSVEPQAHPQFDAARTDKMSVVVPATAKQTATVIFLHGLGDSGHGWAPVMKMIKSPHIKYICPNAPVAKVTLNMGMNMPSWYDIIGLHEDAAEDAAGHERTRNQIREIIAEENKAGIPSNRIILGGFSQGGASSLFAGLTHEESLAGIIALSCYLPLRQRFPAAIAEANKKTPIFMAHGEADATVMYKWGEHSYEHLKKAGLNVSFLPIPGMGHSASDSEIAAIKRFVDEKLPAQ